VAGRSRVEEVAEGKVEREGVTVYRRKNVRRKRERTLVGWCSKWKSGIASAKIYNNWKRTVRKKAKEKTTVQ
jgi:hypothetical protein